MEGSTSRDRERRAAPRAPLALRVWISPGEAAVPHHAVDLSAEGVFVLTAKPSDVGALLNLRIELPGAEAIAVSGLVVRSQLVLGAGGTPGLSGMGIRFRDLEEKDRSRLGKLVEAVRRALELG
jgi:uncharacterized protein (TIGR02266 family)